MRPSPLITAAELRDWLERTSCESGRVLLDARPSRADYDAGHLPSAQHAALEGQLSSPGPDAANGGRHPLPAQRPWLQQLGEWGIGPRTAVVVYDAQGSDMAAARCWWMLRASGLQDVRVLDGGLAAASAAGIPLRRSAEDLPTTRGDLQPEIPTLDSTWVSGVCALEEMMALRSSSSQTVVLDARSVSRFRGDGDPYDPVTGHIPGSRSAPYTETLRGDGTFREPGELRRWFEARIGDAERVIVSCGSGVTACHLALGMAVAGLAEPRVYVGSWSEWCRHPELPVGTGSGADRVR